MGRKVNPIGYRLGVIKDWESKWFAEGADYSKLLAEDIAIRGEIRGTLGRAGVSRIDIQRFPKQVNITIVTAKPGIVIGRRGANINALKTRLEQMADIQGKSLRVDVVEVENPEIDARVVAEGIAEQLERRVAHKRIMRQVVQRTMRSGAQGIKILVAGRLSGAEMARREWVREGRVPLHTLRADIDYASEEAATGTGRIGVKVWIYRGDVLPETNRGAARVEGV
ncbi:MAG: 30S ribosomal protein S3 [Anaerolineae bacterium]|nr:30S ribosomal protein S3 [Chloroflexota bacterium]